MTGSAKKVEGSEASRSQNASAFQSSESKEKRSAQMTEQEKKDFERAIEDQRNKTEEYLTSLRHIQTDFENLRRRYQIEIDTARKDTTQSIVTELLVVLDDLELAEKNAGDKGVGKDIIDGIQQIRTKLFRILQKEGLEKIETLGKRFDPSSHQISAKIPSPLLREGMILDEIRAGYKFRGLVIRASLVNVVVQESREQTVKEETSK